MLICNETSGDCKDCSHNKPHETIYDCGGYCCYKQKDISCIEVLCKNCTYSINNYKKDGFIQQYAMKKCTNCRKKDKYIDSKSTDNKSHKHVKSNDCTIAVKVTFSYGKSGIMNTIVYIKNNETDKLNTMFPTLIKWSKVYE